MTHEVIRIFIVVLGSVIGSLGMTFVFGVEKKHIVWALLSAFLCCASYEIGMLCGLELFLSAFVASFITAAYSDVMAHVLKVPATVLIIIGILPLVPGSSLYYTMLGAVQSDMTMFSHYGQSALFLAAGIALGIISVTAVSRPVNAMLGERMHGKADKRK